MARVCQGRPSCSEPTDSGWPVAYVWADSGWPVAHVWQERTHVIMATRPKSMSKTRVPSRPGNPSLSASPPQHGHCLWYDLPASLRVSLQLQQGFSIGITAVSQDSPHVLPGPIDHDGAVDTVLAYSCRRNHP